MGYDDEFLDDDWDSYSEEEEEKLYAPIKLVSTTTALSTKTTAVATTVLLDDASNGFKNGNFVCSPFSLETLLGILAAGAEGETLKQLLGFLGHETIDQLLYESPSAKLLERILSKPTTDRGLDISLANETNIDQLFFESYPSSEELLERILSKPTDRGLDISLSNGIWVNENLTGHIQSCYEEILKSVYKMEASSVDFENKPDESARKINSWVNKETKGLKLDTPDLNGVVIALANALHFKGLWADKPFSSYFTKKKYFHLINGETVSVPFMSSSQEFKYGSFEGVKILRIPYESKDQFSMYIFLPDKQDGLQDLLKLFHSDPALFHERFNLTLRHLDELWIPKFKISYKFEAQEVIKQMGLTLPFEPTNLELSRIVEPRVPDQDMPYVSKILQKSFIEINEEGTEAAAWTTGYMTMASAKRPRPPPPAKFVADHPFMFMIREDKSLAVLFIGVVFNPHIDSSA